MIRDIRYKARRLDNGEWVQGGYIRLDSSQDIGIIAREKMCITSLADERITVPLELDTFAVDARTVLEYIGRGDKNGKRIFEGDIVKTKYGRTCLVQWNIYCERWDLVAMQNLDCKAPDEHDMWNSKNLEVIGSILDGLVDICFDQDGDE